MVRRRGRARSRGAVGDDGRPCETSQRPRFVRRACTSPSGECRCTWRASASSSSRRAGQSAAATVSVRAPSTSLTAGPRRSVDRRRGHAVGDELPPAVASARSRSSSMRASVGSATTSSSGGGRRRNDGDREQLVGRLRREGRLGARDGGEPRLPLEPAGARGTGARTRPGPSRRRTRAAAVPSLARRDHADRERAQPLEPRELARRPPRARRSGRAGARRPRSAARAPAAGASRAASAARRRASPTRRPAARARRAARAGGS